MRPGRDVTWSRGRFLVSGFSASAFCEMWLVSDFSEIRDVSRWKPGLGVQEGGQEGSWGSSYPHTIW